MYDSIEFCADAQNKIYALKQTEQYQPINIEQYFNYDEHAGEAPECILESEFKDIKKILFRYHFYDKELVALQHVIFPVVYENSSKFLFLAFNRQSLHKISHPVLSINYKIDMLIINDVIFTRNIDLLQKYYNFVDLIHRKAENAIEKIQELSIINNNIIIQRYVERDKLSYMKKMMRILSSPVFNMRHADIIAGIQQNERWNSLLKIDQNEKIIINTFKDVEKLIDLFDERYTYSKISNTEYDTKVKRIINE